MSTNIDELIEDYRLHRDAREAIAFLRFALGDDVAIGTSTVYAVMVQPIGVDCTFTWDAEGCTGWGVNGNDTDYYELIRESYYPDLDFYDTEDSHVQAIENNVMALGAALEKSVVAIVEWIDWRQHRALEEVMK